MTNTHICNFTVNKMQPYLKWAGGKRWLISNFNHLLPATTSFNRYFEPFLGGGAIFFHLRPKDGYLSDFNPELINSYKVIQNHWKELLDILSMYHTKHCKEFYYILRASKPENIIEQAARFIYLNRTCWNGLYRVNRNGDFNVPIGTKRNVLMKDDDFEKISNVLKGIDLIHCDFELSIEKAKDNDFIFVDPPYTVKHNLNGFIKYNEQIFSWDDQVRLRNAIFRAIERGAKALVLNANHSSIQELYHGLGETVTLERSSVIAGNSNFRGIYTELAIKCW